jgi:hypothetical protein
MDLESREPNPERTTEQNELAERQRQCYELDQRVKAGLRAGRSAMWMTAEALYDFDKHAGWSTLGYRARADWLADPEVGITERSYQRLVRVWREAVIRRRIEPPALARLDLSKVEIVLAAVDEGSARLPDALSDAEALGWRELRRKYARARSAHSGAPRWPSGAGRPSAVSAGAALRKAGNEEASQPPALAPAQPEPAGASREKEEFDRQLQRWLALYGEVRQAADTGQPLPRVNASLIVPGLDALAHLLQAAGIRGIDRLMP